MQVSTFMKKSEYQRDISHKDQVLYPIKNKWEDLPEGEYQVQALINRYESFNLSTGHTVQLPPDMGEGQHWNTKTLNIFCQPLKVQLLKKGAVTEVNLCSINT